MLKNKIKIALFFIPLFIGLAVFGQDDDQYIREKSILIYNFPKYIQWENDEDLDEITIGVYGIDAKFLKELKKTVKSSYADGTMLIIQEFATISQIKETHVLIVGEQKDAEIRQIFEKRKSWNTLFITENHAQKKYTMINFSKGDKNQATFEVNKTVLADAGLKIASNLLVKDGDVVMMQDLFRESEKELESQISKMNEQKEVLAKQQREIEKQKSTVMEQKMRIADQQGKLNEQKKQMADQQSELVFQQLKIISQQENLVALEKQMEERSKILFSQLAEIEKQQGLIANQKADVEQQTKVLRSLSDESKKAQQKISLQKAILDKQSSQIQTQQGVLFLALALLLVMVAGAFLIYRSYRIKKEVNKKLEIKNIAIMQQKEEISRQAKELENTNKELEKLSIVASETDNAVRIMDAGGNYEWINAGYTRMYGYTLDELILKTPNILSGEVNSMVKDAVNSAIKEKRTYIFESITLTKKGEQMWAQTTLTPIVSSKGEISKLIAIDSNISKLKKAEAEIAAQRDEIEIQRDIANKQKQKITDSIVYANRIQRAVLPPLEIINEHYPNNFVVFKPRDIVSGDFYWMTKKEDKYIIAIADCTGHGVPGAFMSMLGISFLNEIVNKKAGNKHLYALQANEILNELRDHVMTSLHQTGKRGETTDGMDISLVIIDPNKGELQFAGAHNPAVIIRNGEAIQLKADRMSVSWHRKAHVPFTNNEFKMQHGDFLYLFTDGYIDQFGGNKKKKLNIGPFKDFLLEIYRKPAEEQKNLLENFLIEWRGENEQIDDILVFGMELTPNTSLRETTDELNWNSKTILIAEDTELNYILLVQALGRTNVNILRAKNGEEAVDIFRKNRHINLILMDIHMPIMDGNTATREIMRIDPEVPIIAQTAMKLNGEEIEAIQSGCVDYISKPINLKTFLSTVGKYIR